MTYENDTGANNVATAERTAPPAELTLNGIIGVVSEYYGTTPEGLLAKDQNDSGISDARAIVFKLASDHTALSHKKIAGLVDRSQGNVSSTIRKVGDRAAQDPKLQAHLEELARAASGEPLRSTLATWPDLVARHYDISVDELADPKTLEATQARQVTAYLMAARTTLKNGAIARRVGLSDSSYVSAATVRVVEKRQSDSRFDEIVAVLETGKLPDVLRQNDVLQRVAAYYGISQDELLGSDRKDQYARPRAVARHILVRELGSSYSAIARVFGNASMTSGREHVIEVDRRLEKDSRLRQQRAEIIDPSTAEREPAKHRVINTVCDFYGITPDELASEHQSDRFLRPRGVAAYMLHRKLGLSVREVTGELQRNEGAVIAAYQNLEREITENPMLAAQVKYLEGTKRIARNLNERIIMRVSEATGIDPNDVLTGKDVEANFARQMAMSLMAESRHLSSREIAEFFGLASEGSAYRAKRVIEYQRPKNPRLVQQMDYVRQSIFSEKPDTFEYDPKLAQGLNDGQEVLIRGALPHIDESLVHPDILARVYGIVEQVADFYGVPATEIVGRTDEFMINRARRTAVLLCNRARIPRAEAALCFDNRGGSSFGQLIHATEIDADNQPLFAEELEALAQGEERRDVLKETLKSVARYYGVPLSEISNGEGYYPARARVAFLMVMTSQSCATQRQIGATIGRSEETTSNTIIKTSKRLQRDPRFQAEINYLLNPVEVPRPADAQDILHSVCVGYDISLDELRQTRSLQDRMPKRLAGFILADELTLPHVDIAELIQDGVFKVGYYIRKMREEVDQNPRRVLEIDRLRPPNSINFSMTGRILVHVKRKYGLSLADLSSQDQTPELDEARRVAINLLLKRGDYSVQKAAKFLKMPTEHIEQFVQ